MIVITKKGKVAHSSSQNKCNTDRKRCRFREAFWNRTNTLSVLLANDLVGYFLNLNGIRDILRKTTLPTKSSWIFITVRQNLWEIVLKNNWVEFLQISYSVTPSQKVVLSKFGYIFLSYGCCYAVYDYWYSCISASMKWNFNNCYI